MPYYPVWSKILEAPSTSYAIELAADLPLQTLSDTPLPYKYDELSFHAQKNVRAVARSMCITIPGTPDLVSNGWKHWPTSNFEKHLFGRQETVESLRLDEKGVMVRSIGSNSLQDSPQRKKMRVCASDNNVSTLDDNEITHKQMSSIDARPEQKEADSSRHSSKSQAPSKTSHEPSSVELKHVQIVREWATTRSHTDPPSESLQVLVQSKAFNAMLKNMISSNRESEVIAPVVRVLTEVIGTHLADQVMGTLIYPYVATLKNPAPHDAMDAFTIFSKRHGRATLPLYRVSHEGKPTVNGAQAEILVRITATLSADRAILCCRAFCERPWGEDGIRVAEALVGSCKDDDSLAELIIGALQKNIVGSEKSVRFGKLLFTAAKCIPTIASAHAEAMKAVCLRSKVFLAKRAVALIHKRDT